LKTADLVELTALAALWGASFLFMRMGAGEFGPVALAGLRVAGASVFLLPLLLARGQLGVLRAHWRPIAIVGLSNSALPFLAYSYAALSIGAGLSSIFNATAPLWGALIAWLWLKDRLSALRVLGLVIGFGGVLWLVGSRAGIAPDASRGDSGWAIAACLAATLLYGWSANFTKRHLAGVAPLAVATGSQVSAALVLVLPMAWWWPERTPSATSWLAVLALAVGCTAVAYLLYFRLIARIGPANAIAVTFLIPVFAVGWGWLFLAERVTPAIVIGCAVILAGTALATGAVRLRRRSSATAP
jgi:drug/metabolite transporter (DMT)-like permease